MRIEVNGKSLEVPEGTTLRDLIVQLRLKDAACAAEVNKSLIPRRQHEACGLREGDRVELATLVGGG